MSRTCRGWKPWSIVTPWPRSSHGVYMGYVWPLRTASRSVGIKSPELDASPPPSDEGPEGGSSGGGTNESFKRNDCNPHGQQQVRHLHRLRFSKAPSQLCGDKDFFSAPSAFTTAHLRLLGWAKMVQRLGYLGYIKVHQRNKPPSQEARGAAITGNVCTDMELCNLDRYCEYGMLWMVPHLDEDGAMRPSYHS